MRVSNFRAALIFSVSTFLAGCATAVRTVTPSDANKMPVVWTQGIANLTSNKKNSVVVSLVSSTFLAHHQDVYGFFVGIRNLGPDPIDFSTSNVKIFSGPEYLDIYTYEQLERIIEKEAARKRFAAVVAAGLQSVAAALPQQSITSGTIHTTTPAYGTTISRYSGVSTTYDPAAAASAQAEIQAGTKGEIHEIERDRASRLDQIQVILRRNTVFPGGTAGGIVAVNPGDLNVGMPVRVVVTLPGESHDFLFNVTKESN